MTTLRRTRARRGLTLMELIIVILILVALAGVLVPIFPSLIGRAHTSTGATNGAELTKAVQMHEATYFGYPDALDSLIGDGTAALFTQLPGGTVGGDLAATPLGGLEVPLQAAGIANVWDQDNATAAPTFDPYPANIRPLAAAGSVATLTPTGKANLGLPAGPVYAVFGVGKNCTMVGRSIADPPVHFADDGANSPDKVYGRSGLVFQLTRADGTTPLSRAKFAGTCSFHDDGVVRIDGHLAEYYESANGGE